jgi:flagellar basal body rod protein FlgF
MNRKILFILLILLSQYIYADRNDLLDEYNLLYTDLLNLRTWGYKSFFDNNSFQAYENINISQGAIQMTDVLTDFVIIGEGFFKIRLEDNLIGYTRNGEFSIDSDGNIRTLREGYFLYENINLGELFLPETLKIYRGDHSVFINIIENNEPVEKKVGQLITYRIPNNYLQHYEGAIYLIKEDVEYHEEVVFCNTIINGALELSNYLLLPVILRMYYILSVLDETLILNIEFKKELIKLLIYKLSNNVTTIEEMDYRINFLGNILPFIKYDY